MTASTGASGYATRSWRLEFPPPPLHLSGVSRITLTIVGMHCPHCVTKVSQALEQVGGVEHVAVFLEQGEAEVDTADHTPVAQLTAAVTTAGYPATLKS